jgi:alpha-glucosidase
MQWEAGPFAGFSNVEPWLPLTGDAATRNVASQKSDPQSLYNLYRRLLAVRHGSAALTSGTFRPVTVTNSLLIYRREAPGEGVLVALNFGSQPTMADLSGAAGKVLVSTFDGGRPDQVTGSTLLPAYAGAVIALGS